MKIKVFHSYGGEWRLSGVNTWTVNLIQGMDPGQFEQKVLFTGVPHRTQPELETLGIRYTFLDLPAKRPRRAEWRALKDFLEANSPCIYVPNYDFHRSCAVGILAHSVATCAVIHSDEPCWYDEVERLGTNFDAIVAVSSCISQNLRKRFPKVAERVTYIPHGIPLPASRGGLRSDSKVLKLVYCNRLEQYQKRVFDLPKIAAELKRRGVAFRLTVAGDGPDAEALRSRFRDDGLDAEVTMTGRVPNSEIMRFLSESDVFLLTSDFEGLPISLLEAMSMGVTPVVYQIASGIEDVVQTEQNGILVPHGNVVEFAAVLEKLSRDRARLERLGRGAAATIAEKFSLARMCRDYSILVESLHARATENGHHARISGVRPPRDLTLSGRLSRRLRAYLSPAKRNAESLS